MSSCPDEAELEAHLVDPAPGPRRETLLAHLRSCAKCRRRMDEARADEELLPEIQRVARAAPSQARPAVAPGAAPSADRPPPATDIARYTIVRRVAAGGMGVVYEAEQKNPRRRVALKVLRSSFASDSMRRRFELECEVLGRLDHPGIARIHEAGTLVHDGEEQPFFAMEFVDGQPLDRWLEQERPPRAVRLELCARICDAIAHAHERGIVHRDLKPGNLLVTAAGDPRVVDFGVARALDGDIGRATLVTETGQVVGTLPYMSPEQLEGDRERLDLPSDVYSLGVVLFEMVAGRLPHDLAGRTVTEAVRIVADRDAPLLGELDRTCRGDLETIVAKALEKDPARRYRTAGELGADVRHFLRHEPIAARPASTAYLLRKFVRRHRTLTTGLVVLFVTLCAGAATTAWQAFRASKGEQAALEREREAVAARDFLLEILMQAAPGQSSVHEPTVREAFEVAARRVDLDLREPGVQAWVHHILGRAFIEMEQPERARPHLERALAIRRERHGDEHLDVAAVKNEIGNSFTRTDPVAAERWIREALATRERLGFDDVRLMCRNHFYLGRVLWAQGRRQEALEHYEWTVAHEAPLLQERPADVYGNRFHVAMARWDLGQRERALADMRAILAGQRGILPQGESTHAAVLEVVAERCGELGLWEEAAGYLDEVCVVLRRRRELEAPRGRRVLGSLVRALEQARRTLPRDGRSPAAACALEVRRGRALVALGEGERATAEVKALAERIEGDEAGLRATGAADLEELAVLLQELGEGAAAEALLAAAVALAPDGATTLDVERLRIALGECLLRQGAAADAEGVLLEAHDAIGALAGESHELARRAAEALVQTCDALGQADEAAAWREKARR